jgi:hypothetical protein
MSDFPARQHVVTIPKMLRLCFKYDRKLFGLSASAATPRSSNSSRMPPAVAAPSPA